MLPFLRLKKKKKDRVATVEVRVKKLDVRVAQCVSYFYCDRCYTVSDSGPAQAL